MIKAGAPWVKGIPSAARVVAEAEKEAALLMQQQDPGDPGSTRCDLAGGAMARRMLGRSS